MKGHNTMGDFLDAVRARQQEREAEESAKMAMLDVPPTGAELRKARMDARELAFMLRGKASEKARGVADVLVRAERAMERAERAAVRRARIHAALNGDDA